MYNFTSPRAQRRIERILKLLGTEALTVDQLHVRLHAAKSNTHQYIRHLHQATPKQIFIAGWDTSGFRAVAIFAPGSDEDAPKPVKTKAQIWQEIKADPAKLARVHGHQAALRTRRRGGKPPAKAIKTYDPPLQQQVREFVEVWPGMTSRQIADKLDAGLKMTKQVLTDLRKQGVATYKRRTRAGGLWELTSRQAPAYAPMVVKQQGIFAALGL